jgi:diphosphomevalonate decarboxylase
MEQRFVAKNAQPTKERITTRWQAPSNIALVKYWGKTAPQLPKNASISFTLSYAVTQTQVLFTPLEYPSDQVSFSIVFEGKEKPGFRPKLEAFFANILPYQPFLAHYQLAISSQNTFPHSSGIASSASSMAALAACLVDLESQLCLLSEEEKIAKMSFLARLGSGSACRSTKGPMMAWGTHPDITNSSDLLAVTVADMHPVFEDFCDTILLVDKEQKQVSSTLGHKLMHDHPYSAQRFAQANTHLAKLLPVLRMGDIETFISIVEKEALHLHAMMMTSDPYFILMQPNTLSVIRKIWAFREETKIPVCFTLDAGANVHVLYPNNVAAEVHQFMDNELLQLCQNQQCLHDEVGMGIKKY